MANSPYLLSNTDLLNTFMRACSRAGASNNGMVIDFMAPYDAQYAQYLKGVVLARIDGKQPPFTEGSIVVLSGQDPLLDDIYLKAPITPGTHLAINQVHYLGNNQWRLVFKGIDPAYDGRIPIYKPDRFTLVEVEATAAIST